MSRLSPKLHQILVRLGLVTGSLLVFGLAAELLLRAFPVLLPAGAYYGSGRYDAELGFYLPDAPVIYNKSRYLVRTPNRDGFMDVEHDPLPVDGVTGDGLRIGFFGDSYVESIQVPLEQTFFRRLPAKLDGQAVEPFAFGISGLGTLHSLLLYRQMAPRYGLDVVVYLFVENDPGDHLHRLQVGRAGLHTPRPTAIPSPQPPGFEILQATAPEQKPFYLRAAMMAKNHLLFARVVYARLQLLWRRPAGEPGPTRPTARDLPGSWPTDLRAEAETVTSRILERFQDEVEQSGRQFLVLYVPRGTEAVDGRVPASDTWLPWLRETCRGLGIDLLDPTPDLRARLQAGDAVYDDHWTPAGHEVIARVTARKLQERLPQQLQQRIDDGDDNK